MRLIDLVEQWAIKKRWWYHKSNEEDMSTGRLYINLSIDNRTRRNALGMDYATLYDDGELSFGFTREVHLKPADPAFFDKLEEELTIGRAEYD